jgi:hypothetical protein
MFRRATRACFMSYDIFLQAFRNGEKASGDAGAARAVIERFPFKHQPEFDAFDIDVDGGSIEMYASGLDGKGDAFTGAMIALRGLSGSMADFIYEFCDAAGFVIFNPGNPLTLIVPREDLVQHLPAKVATELPQVPVANGAEMFAALRGGYKGWSEYRDRVVRETQSGGSGGGT